MSARRIQVRVSPTGEITVEAHGFQGRGCEAATKAIEDALGKPGVRTRQPDYTTTKTTKPPETTHLANNTAPALREGPPNAPASVNTLMSK